MRVLERKRGFGLFTERRGMGFAWMGALYAGYAVYGSRVFWALLKKQTDTRRIGFF
jgi:hypothetical protein